MAAQPELVLVVVVCLRFPENPSESPPGLNVDIVCGGAVEGAARCAPTCPCLIFWVQRVLVSRNETRQLHPAGFH
jgi:hypothetical protein